MGATRISFQLYSARHAPSIEAVLSALAAIGYDAVEPFAGNYMDDPAAFRALADRHGLKIPSAHMPFALLRDDTARAIEISQVLGLETVVAPYLDEAARPVDEDGWRALGVMLGDIAGLLAGAGLRLAWHNHDFEYAPLADGSLPMDHLLASPRVFSELDLGWVARAGRDPAVEVARLSARLAAVHFKDIAPAGVVEQDGWADVGAGTIAWPAVWDVVRQSSADIIVVEHDNPADWEAFARNSFRHVSALSGRG